VIDISVLREGLAEDADWVMFDPEGNILHGEVPVSAGPATLMVAPVTDAVKTVEDGKVTGSVDRSKLWRVEAFLLNRVILDELGAGSFDVDSLLDAVEGTGVSWQAVPRSATT
jgi:hypothetical protein